MFHRDHIIRLQQYVLGGIHVLAQAPHADFDRADLFLLIRDGGRKWNGSILRPASYLRHLAKVIPDLPRRPPAVRDPEMRRWASSQDGFRTFNLLATISALELIDEVTPLVGEITTPTLIIQGRLDTVVEPFNARWLYSQLSATAKALMIPRRERS